MCVCVCVAATSCGDCDGEGLLQSSVIIGIVVWLLLLTLFFLLIVVAFICTSTPLHHRAKTDAAAADAPSAAATNSADRPRPLSAVRRHPRAGGGVVPRRFSSSRSFYPEPWMNALAENVWKDYPLETIDDT